MSEMDLLGYPSVVFWGRKRRTMWRPRYPQQCIAKSISPTSTFLRMMLERRPGVSDYRLRSFSASFKLNPLTKSRDELKEATCGSRASAKSAKVLLVTALYLNDV